MNLELFSSNSAMGRSSRLPNQNEREVERQIFDRFKVLRIFLVILSPVLLQPELLRPDVVHAHADERPFVDMLESIDAAVFVHEGLKLTLRIRDHDLECLELGFEVLENRFAQSKHFGLIERRKRKRTRRDDASEISSRQRLRQNTRCAGGIRTKQIHFIQNRHPRLRIHVELFHHLDRHFDFLASGRTRSVDDMDD